MVPVPRTLSFHSDVAATIGIEEEFHIIDPSTSALTPAASRLMIADNDDVVEPELQRSMIETATPICADLAEVTAAVVAGRTSLRDAADRAGVWVATAGAVPEAGRPLGDVFNRQRYRQIADEYRQLVTEQQVCAMQVQVGVPDRELSVLLLRRIRDWLPTLLAMSASSPYFLGADTGYASYRSIVVARWPTAGPPPVFHSLREYDSVVERLIRSGVITDSKMIYFDVRPSARYPTLELRITDGCPLIEDVTLLAGLARALVATAAAEERAGVEARETDYAMLRGATWRAGRSGLDGMLVDPRTAEGVPAGEMVRRLLEHLRPALEHFDDWRTVSDLAAQLLARGTSARRQRRFVATDPELNSVVAELVRETYSGLGVSSR
jgi:glutamate---cysteine ligase / carboxylate-amine ligase